MVSKYLTEERTELTSVVSMEVKLSLYQSLPLQQILHLSRLGLLPMQVNMLMACD